MRRILVIDDEPDIRLVVKTSLEVVGGWAVMVAETGPQGVETAKTTPPDAILLDVMMPGEDGPRTLARLQTQVETRDIPVIFLTAKVQQAEITRLQSLGAKGVLAKPFDPMTLPSQLEQLLGWGS